ncbi:hypothetical protein SK128_014395, partial [Halocaridina rubra]
MTIETASPKTYPDLYFEYMRQEDDRPSITGLIQFLQKETEARECREQPFTLDNTSSRIGAT